MLLFSWNLVSIWQKTGHWHWAGQHFWKSSSISFLFPEFCLWSNAFHWKSKRTHYILNYRLDLQCSCLLASLPQNSHLTSRACVVLLMLSPSLSEFMDWGCSPQHLAELILCLLLLTYSSTTTSRVSFQEPKCSLCFMDYSKQIWKGRLLELSINFKWHREKPEETEIILNEKFKW